MPKDLNHLGDVRDGSGTAHRDFKSMPSYFTSHGMDINFHILTAPVDALGIYRFLFEELVRQPDGPQLETVRLDHFSRLPDEEFSAAPSDVNEQNLFVENGQGLQNPKVDQS